MSPSNTAGRSRGQLHSNRRTASLDDGNVGNLNANTLMRNCPDNKVAAAAVVDNPCTLCLIASEIAAAFLVIKRSSLGTVIHTTNF